jgi:transposase-like protein
MGTARPPRPAYPPEFRARAVELARASELPPSQIARDLGIDPDTLRRWLRQADVDAGRLQGATTDEKAELVRLRREVALLREERDILQKATAYFARASAPR